MLHPISTLITFGWRKTGGILVKWRNCLNREMRGNWNLTLKCSLLKTMASGSCLVDTGSLLKKRIRMLIGVRKRSLNSHTLSCSIDFLDCVRPTTSLGRTFFLSLRIGRSVTPSRCHSNMVGRVEPAQHKDRILKSSHPTLLFSKQCLRCIKANLHLFKACNRAEPELNL